MITMVGAEPGEGPHPRIFAQLKLSVYFPAGYIVFRITRPVGCHQSASTVYVCMYVCLYQCIPNTGLFVWGMFPGVVGVHRYVSTYV